MRTLERWLQEDVWTKTYWLPSNPEWKTYAPAETPKLLDMTSYLSILLDVISTFFQSLASIYSVF